MDKENNELDKFVADSIRILSGHMDYVAVSGYVAILPGRSGTTENTKYKPEIERLFQSFISNGYWFLNDDDPKQIVPNIELELVRDDTHKESSKNKIMIFLAAKRFLSAS